MAGLENFVEIRTHLLEKAPWNYKTDDEDKKNKLKGNLRQNGVLENIVVREMPNGKYEVVNGNHRLDAIRELSIEVVPAYNLGVVSEKKAKRIAIELNETHFDPDSLKLAGVIKELVDEYSIDDLEETMPYNKQEIEDYQKLLDFDWGQYGEGEGKDEKGLPEVRELKFNLPESVYALWSEWKNRCITEHGIHTTNEPKMLEMALSEALNTPSESVK
jgi:hypothetical protein